MRSSSAHLSFLGAAVVLGLGTGSPRTGAGSEQSLSAVGMLLTSVLLSRFGRQTAGRSKGGFLCCPLQLLPSYLPGMIYRTRERAETGG